MLRGLARLPNNSQYRTVTSRPGGDMATLADHLSAYLADLRASGSLTQLLRLGHDMTARM